MNTFFTSDLHLGHFNIIRYCGRPFTSLEEMDTTLIRKFNERVKEDDFVYLVGDFCFRKSTEAQNSHKDAFTYYREQLRCKNILFLQGNHDRNNGIKTQVQSTTIKFGGERIFLTHKPAFANPKFSLNFCGHEHEKFKFRAMPEGGTIVNVGVEQWNYYPVTFNEINSELIQWKKRQITEQL